VRELREETGWTDLEPGALLCAWEHDFTRAGVPCARTITSTGTPARVAHPVGDHLGVSHTEEGILGWRWWTPQRAGRLAEPLWPPRLPSLLAELDDATTSD